MTAEERAARQAMAERWAAEIDAQLKDAPQLTPEQVRTIRALLRPKAS